MMIFKEFADKVLKSGKTTPTIPIVVPSYRRPEARVLNWLSVTPELEAIIFIRKTEYNIYKHWEKYPNIRIVKLRNVTNIGETRRVMMKWCLCHDIPEAFQLDDDITCLDYLYEYTSPKGQTYLRQAHLNRGFKIQGANPVAFAMWEALIRRIEQDTGTEVALCGMPHRSLSWGLKTELYTLNRSHPAGCMYINYKLLSENGVTYKSSSEVGWEDLYVTLQAIKKGLNVARAWNMTFSTSEMGKNPGGCNGDNPEESCYERSKKNCEIFMENVAKGDTAISVKESPKRSLVGIKVDWDKLKRDDE